MKKMTIYKLNIGDVDITMSTRGFSVLCDKSGSTVHNHAEFEYHFSMREDASVRFDDEKVTLPQGQSMLICPKIFHRFLKTEKESCVLSFCFSLKQGKRGAKYYDKLIAALNGKNYLLFEQNDVLTNLIHTVMSEIYSTNIFAAETIRARITLFFIQLFSMILESNERTESSADTQEYDTRTYIIEEYFNEHYMENITLTGLAERLYLGEKQTERMIRKIYNTGFRESLTTIRVKSAMDLLSDPTKSLAQIAEEVGYTSYYGFYSAFKKATGMTPKEYREGLSDKT